MCAAPLPAEPSVSEIWALTWHDLRPQTGTGSGRESESSSAASRTAQPAAKQRPELGALHPSGQSAAGGAEENCSSE